MRDDVERGWVDFERHLFVPDSAQAVAKVLTPELAVAVLPRPLLQLWYRRRYG